MLILTIRTWDLNTVDTPFILEPVHIYAIIYCHPAKLSVGLILIKFKHIQNVVLYTK